jgi:putative transposase
MPDHKGWYYSGAAPHCDIPTALQFVTFRLADSLPQQVLAELERQLMRLPDRERNSARAQGMEKWLDRGLGCCVLAHPAMATRMQSVLQSGDGERYQLLAWCIMPNHVHVLLAPNYPLARIVQAWKSLTTRWARNQNALLHLSLPQGSLWRRDYWDSYIRNEAHLQRVEHYIHQNPVKAGLASTAADWPWSSARVPDTER